jgi:hypothetical protein
LVDCWSSVANRDELTVPFGWSLLVSGYTPGNSAWQMIGLLVGSHVVTSGARRVHVVQGLAVLPPSP